MITHKIETKTVTKWNCSTLQIQEKSTELIRKMTDEINVLKLDIQNTLKQELMLKVIGVDVKKYLEHRYQDIDRWDNCIQQVQTLAAILTDYLNKGINDFQFAFDYPSNFIYLRRPTTYLDPETGCEYKPVSPVNLLEKFLDSVNCYYDYTSSNIPNMWYIKPQLVKETIQDYAKPSAVELFKDMI